jgi:LacI family transcriptional regulator
MRAQNTPIETPLVETGNFVFKDGVACAQRLLSLANPPTAIFASNDDMAAAVISVAHKMGLELPTQLSVVGFDDAPVATMIWPLLTTVRQPVATMARLAAELIIENSPRRLGWPSPPPHRTLDFELIVRDSTAAPNRKV